MDVIICNGRSIYKQLQPGTSQLDFRREIVKYYLTTYKKPPTTAGNLRVSGIDNTTGRVLDSIRFDGKDHLPFQTEKKSRRRCAGSFCATRTQTECRKCNVGLCFAKFI